MRRSKEKSQAPLISAPGFGMLFRSDMQQYRSGHNGADSKSVWSNPRGFESHLLRQKRKSPCRKTRAFSFLMGDSNPERVSGVQKTVRWTVFSREVRSSYAARTDDAKRSCSGIIPHPLPLDSPRILPNPGFLFVLSAFDVQNVLNLRSGFLFSLTFSLIS